MTRKRGSMLAVLLSVIILLAACGGGSSNSEPVTGGDNDVVGDGVPGDGSMVDGVPVPLAPGAYAVSTNKSGPFTTVLYLVPFDQQVATIAFYDQWTDAQPDGYLRTEAESGGIGWQNDPEAGEDKVHIQVLSPLEGDDFITVTLTVGPAE